jgi:hypothetical protein
MKILIALILALTACAPSLAATKTPIAVECRNSTEDFVGASFCTALRDTIASSPRHTLLGKSSAEGNWSLIVTTTGSQDTGSQAIVLVWKKPDMTQYLDSWVLQTSYDNKKQVANLFSSIDADITKVLK